MADKTLPLAEGEGLTPEESLQIQAELSQARAILRTVALAAAAQEDGSMSYENDNPCRWGPAVGRVCSKVQGVRDVLMERVSVTGDWFTPLAMVEALDAALWHSNMPHTPGKCLNFLEVRAAAEAAIECLSELAAECTASSERTTTETGSA